MNKQRKDSYKLSDLVEQELQGLSPIQTIMKMAEPRNIINMGLKPEEVISFGGGWCNHKVPDLLHKTYIDIVNNSTLFHQSGRYSAIKGDHSCCEQLCSYEKTIYNIPDLTPDNILLGHSSTQLFHDILRVLQNPGEHICLLDPTYANYHNAIKCALPKSKLLYVPALDTENWKYLPDEQQSLDTLQKHCEQGAKTFVIPIPDNPTSQIPSDSFIQAAREIMQDNRGFLILDFAYKPLYYQNMPTCYQWSPNNHENLITLHSNSKWLSSLGRRFGWIEAHPTITKGLEKITESTLLSPDTLHSMATTRYLQQSIQEQTLKPYLEKIKTLYKEAADILTESIETYLGWNYLKPQGGLYTVCPTPNKEDPIQFVEKILKHTGVLLIPGVGFGPSMKKAIRISYGPLCYDHDLIEKGIKKVGEYLKT